MTVMRRFGPLAATVACCATMAVPKRVVLKFGGSSVRDAERITEVCKLVSTLITENGYEPCLVCSAMGKTTNGLLAAADMAINEQEVDLSSVRKLHQDTIETLGLSGTAYAEDILALVREAEIRLQFPRHNFSCSPVEHAAAVPPTIGSMALVGLPLVGSSPAAAARQVREDTRRRLASGGALGSHSRPRRVVRGADVGPDGRRHALLDGPACDPGTD